MGSKDQAQLKKKVTSLNLETMYISCTRVDKHRLHSNGKNKHLMKSFRQGSRRTKCSLTKGVKIPFCKLFNDSW